jgi:hypothetical protein
LLIAERLRALDLRHG